MEIKFTVWMDNEKLCKLVGCDNDVKLSNKMITWEELLKCNKSWLGELIAGEYDNYIIKRLYTGLRDKNGKEIYEGDILSGSNENYFTIEWNKNEARYSLKSTEKNLSVSISVLDRLEVIGNIYENKNLLKGGKR